MSVLEIDGASNNGVDAVREIREDVKIAPATGLKKIYIIDEVHMLSTAAFNALLKTLEEPPPHVIFIFATTEAHKIPATILGRCQRFDLRRVTVAQIQHRIAHVLEQEGIAAESGAIALIARAGDGSMRDALSLLDQVIAFAGNTITTQAVRESIGLIESQTLMAIASGIIRRKPLEAIAALDQAFQSGHDLRVMTRGLIELLHAAILARVGAQGSEALVISPEEWSELATLAAERPVEELELMFQVLHHGLDWIARSPQPKIVLDVLLIKCASAEVLLAPSASTKKEAPLLRPAPKPQPLPSPPPVETPVAVSAATPRTWEGFIDFVRSSRPLLATLLEHGAALRLPLPEPARGDDTDLLSIGFSPQQAYYREQLLAKLYQDQVLALAKGYFQRHVRLRIEQAEIAESLAARREREKSEHEASGRQAALQHPLVVEARSLFGGELGPIELKGAAD
jgi:DNA polymerase-3 subunit gamma/tau